jgi:hypothetical protein
MKHKYTIYPPHLIEIAERNLPIFVYIIRYI